MLAKLSEKVPSSIIPFSNAFFNIIYTNQQLSSLVCYIYDGTFRAYPQSIDYYIKSGIKCVLLSNATSNIICGTCYSYNCEIDVYDNANHILASKLITSDDELYGVDFEIEEDDKIIMTYYTLKEEKYNFSNSESEISTFHRLYRFFILLVSLFLIRFDVIFISIKLKFIRSMNLYR